jgi:hypothetical protein
MMSRALCGRERRTSSTPPRATIARSAMRSRQRVGAPAHNAGARHGVVERRPRAPMPSEKERLVHG